MIRAITSLAATALALALGAGVAQAQVPEPDNDPFYAVPAHVATHTDGTILDSREITATAMGLPMPADAWQVLYKTTDNTGTPTATVVTVMVPTAAWTGTGPRPVVSYQTAEDAVGTKCAPSYAIRGGLTAGRSNSAPETLLMQQALVRGWTVVAPDYEGPRSMFLGAEGEARGVLDGLRAARAFAPAGIDAAAPIGMWGYSGGAFATSVAAQMQPRHAPELKLTAVALGGIVADIKETIRAFSGSVFGGALVMGFVGVDRAYPEYELTQYINAAGRAAMAQSQTDCINDAVTRFPGARLEDYADPALLDSAPLKPMFERINPLTFPGVPAAPVYHYHAINDELAPIGPARKLMERFCRAGVPVQRVENAIGEHLTEVATGWVGAMAYLGDRFAGKAAPNGCGVQPDPVASMCTAQAQTPRTTVRRAGARLTRTRVTLRGTAVGSCDPAGAAKPRRVTKVTVSIARIAGARCQHLGTAGRLRAARSCSRPVRLAARGTSTWTFRRTAALRPGRYRIDVRAADSAGRTSASTMRLRVR